MITTESASSKDPHHSRLKAVKAKSISNTSSKAEKARAMDVPLSEEGYKRIAKLKDDKEMSLFVKRVADDLGYEISDVVGSLSGVIPYYSGKKATQSFMALKEEFNRTSTQTKGWAKKLGKTSSHEKPRQTSMIEKKDESNHKKQNKDDSTVKKMNDNSSTAKALKKKASKK